jgi:glycosyltransferase involved in cell wall biosynthesis
VATSNIAFIYWGRRGFSRFTLELARAARELKDVNAYFSISTANEIFPEFQELGSTIFPVDTFHTAAGALCRLPRIFALKHRLIQWLSEREINRVIVLMPHVWTPLIAASIRRLGIHYSVVFHDANPHPGDRTGLVFEWLLNDARAADTVITLSPWVKTQLVKRGAASAERTRTLFMPDISYPNLTAQGGKKVRWRKAGQPLRILFFGRMLKYKGLSTFIDALELLAADSIPIEISVCGEGDISQELGRLARLRAAVLNRWLSDDEVGELMHQHDVAVLTHIEASQSGIIAAAMGTGLPVIATPVGGLADQVESRGAGLVSARSDPQAVAECIRSLALDCELYNSIVNRMNRCRGFLMADFLRTLISDVNHEDEQHARGTFTNRFCPPAPNELLG